MKIAFLLPKAFIGGGIACVYEHAQRFLRKGHECRIVLQSGTSEVNDSWYGDLSGAEFMAMEDAANGDAFDIAIATGWQTVFDIGHLNARHFGYLVQDDERQFYESPYLTTRLFIEMTYKLNILMFATTPRLSQMLLTEFGQRSFLVPYAIRDNCFLNAQPTIPKSRKLRVLVEGRGLEPRKRIGLTFEVIKEVDNLEIFYIASDGFCAREWAPDRLFCKVPHLEMPGLYASCDVLLKLSSQESFAMPVLEMFATGGTAIVTAFPGHEDYICHEKNALVVPIDDRDSARVALQRLRDNRELRQTLQLNAREAPRKYSWERSNDTFLKCLDSLGETNCVPPSLDAYRIALEDYLKHCERLSAAESELGTRMHRFASRLRRALHGN